MYAIAQVKIIFNGFVNDFEPDIDSIEYKEVIYSPTISDQAGNRKAQNWCILWLKDPANTTGPGLFKIDESVGNLLWSDINQGRKNQIISALETVGINTAFINNSLSIKDILMQVIQLLQPGKILDNI